MALTILSRNHVISIYVFACVCVCMCVCVCVCVTAHVCVFVCLCLTIRAVYFAIYEFIEQYTNLVIDSDILQGNSGILILVLCVHIIHIRFL